MYRPKDSDFKLSSNIKIAEYPFNMLRYLLS